LGFQGLEFEQPRSGSSATPYTYPEARHAQNTRDRVLYVNVNQRNQRINDSWLDSENGLPYYKTLITNNKACVLDYYYCELNKSNVTTMSIFYQPGLLGIHGRRKVQGILSPNPAADNRTTVASS